MLTVMALGMRLGPYVEYYHAAGGRRRHQRSRKTTLSRQDNRLNRVFKKAWTIWEPPGFSDFLDMEWSVHLKAFGLHSECERESSFSRLYLLRKA